MANITDRGYLGLGCLNIFAPLLRPLDKNPHATILTLFLNAVAEVKTDDDVFGTLNRERARIIAYLPPSRDSMARTGNVTDAETVRRISALDLLLDVDSLFVRYMRESSFSTFAKNSGLRHKPKHTLIEPWPLRLGKRATKADFEKLFGSGHQGHERYIEWQRAL